MILFLLFFFVSMAEIALCVWIGGYIGIGWTIAIAILTAVLGSTLLRHQGLGTLHSFHQSQQQGRAPLKEIFDGLCLIAAGALLITPGFLTDTIGLLLFIPQFRALLRDALAESGKVYMFGSQYEDMRDAADTARNTTVIEGEYEKLDEQDIDRQNKS